MNLFYDNLVEIHTLRPHLEQYLDDETAIQEVLFEIDAALHHVVMEVIFSHLPRHTHEAFLRDFRENPAAHQHLLFLRQYIPDIDERIRSASHLSKQKFIDAIHA